MVSSALRGFLRSIMVKLRSRPAFPVQFNVAAGLRLETFPAHRHPVARLSSWTYSGPDGGRSTFDGRHGWIKAVGLPFFGSMLGISSVKAPETGVAAHQ